VGSRTIAYCAALLHGAGLVALVLLLTLTAASAERRIALVLGNSQYQHAAPLANPARDGQASSMRLRWQKFGTSNCTLAPTAIWSGSEVLPKLTDWKTRSRIIRSCYAIAIWTPL